MYGLEYICHDLYYRLLNIVQQKFFRYYHPAQAIKKNDAYKKARNQALQEDKFLFAIAAIHQLYCFNTYIVMLEMSILRV